MRLRSVKGFCWKVFRTGEIKQKSIKLFLLRIFYVFVRHPAEVHSGESWSLLDRAKLLDRTFCVHACLGHWWNSIFRAVQTFVDQRSCSRMKDVFGFVKERLLVTATERVIQHNLCTGRIAFPALFDFCRSVF